MTETNRPGDLQRILSWLTDQQPAMERMLGELVAMETPSNNKPALDALARDMERRLSGICRDVETLPRDTGDMVRARFRSGTGRTLVLGHMDTVWPVGELARRPFRIENGQAMGPGVLDMKGGLVQIFWALAALDALGITPSREVVVLLNADEETGSIASRAVIESEAQGAAAVLVVEPGGPEGAAKVFRKGVGRYNLEVLGRAAHSGSDKQHGISAILEMARQVIRIEEAFAGTDGTTVNVGVVAGGTTSNTVPARATAEIDMRFAEPEAGRAAERFILESKPFTPGAEIRVSGLITRPVFEKTPANMALYETARELAREIGFDLPAAEVGGASDGNFTSALGVPTLDGLGPRGGGSHSLGENVELSSLAPRTAMLAGLLAL